MPLPALTAPERAWRDATRLRLTYTRAAIAQRTAADLRNPRYLPTMHEIALQQARPVVHALSRAYSDPANSLATQHAAYRVARYVATKARIAAFIALVAETVDALDALPVRESRANADHLRDADATGRGMLGQLRELLRASPPSAAPEALLEAIDDHAGTISALAGLSVGNPARDIARADALALVDSLRRVIEQHEALLDEDEDEDEGADDSISLPERSEAFPDPTPYLTPVNPVEIVLGRSGGRLVLDAPTPNLVHVVRVQRGLTQNQAAALLGVHRRDWIYYEQGGRTLRWLRWVGWQVLADQGAEDYAHIAFGLPTPATFTALRARSRLGLEGLCELTRLPPDQWARCESLEVTAHPEFFRAFSVGLQLILECNNL
jgi:hypothetical protein